MEDYKYLFKIIAVGDAGVGKTSLINRYMDSVYTPISGPTIGCDFRIRTITPLPDTPVKLQVWDTSGQERFHSITQQFYRNANAVFVVYDSTDLESFENVPRWIEDVERLAPDGVLKYLISTKNDLTKTTDIESEFQMNMDQINEFARLHGLTFIATSAKNGDNVEHLFQHAATVFTEKAMKDNAGYPLNSSLRPNINQYHSVHPNTNAVSFITSLFKPVFLRCNIL